MVPMDQPAAAFNMINRFMANKDLADEGDSGSSTGQAATQQQQHQSVRAFPTAS